MVQAFTNARQTIRTAMGVIDGLKARQRDATQGGEQFLAPDLGGVVIEGGQRTVDEPEPVPFATAVDQVNPLLPARHPECCRRWSVRIQSGGDERVQSVGGDCSRPDQLQVGQYQSRRVRQHGQRGEPAARIVVHESKRRGIVAAPFDHDVEPTPGSHPHGTVALPGRAEQNAGFGRPAVDGATTWDHRGQGGVERRSVRRLSCTTA